MTMQTALCMQGYNGSQDLWTYYADCAVAFEKKMSIMRGIYIDDSQMDHDGEPLHVQNIPSCVMLHMGQTAFLP